MFASVKGFDNALKKLGVSTVYLDELAEKYEQFGLRSRDAFEALLRQSRRSTTQHWSGDDHMGYVNHDSHSMWCAWCDALGCVPSLLELGPRSAERETELFRVFAHMSNSAEDSDTVSEIGTDDDTLRRQNAWRAALDFGLTVLQNPVWIPQSQALPVAMSIFPRSQQPR